MALEGLKTFRRPILSSSSGSLFFNSRVAVTKYFRTFSYQPSSSSSPASPSSTALASDFFRRSSYGKIRWCQMLASVFEGNVEQIVCHHFWSKESCTKKFVKITTFFPQFWNNYRLSLEKKILRCDLSQNVVKELQVCYVQRIFDEFQDGTGGNGISIGHLFGEKCDQGSVFNVFDHSSDT